MTAIKRDASRLRTSHVYVSLGMVEQLPKR